MKTTAYTLCFHFTDGGSHISGCYLFPSIEAAERQASVLSHNLIGRRPWHGRSVDRISVVGA